MLLRNIMRNLESKPEAPEDVMKMSMRPGLKYYEYEQTKNMTLKQLLPKPVSGALILMMDKHSTSNVGHFVLLMQHPRSGIIFFDPYGFGLARLIQKTKNEKHLLSKLPHMYSDNRIPFQKKADDIQTCGRHVVCRYNAAAMNPKEYQAMMHLPGLTPDDIVMLMTIGADLAHAIDAHNSKRK